MPLETKNMTGQHWIFTMPRILSFYSRPLHSYSTAVSNFAGWLPIVPVATAPIMAKNVTALLAGFLLGQFGLLQNSSATINHVCLHGPSTAENLFFSLGSPFCQLRTWSAIKTTATSKKHKVRLVIHKPASFAHEKCKKAMLIITNKTYTCSFQILHWAGPGNMYTVFPQVHSAPGQSMHHKCGCGYRIQRQGVGAGVRRKHWFTQPATKRFLNTANIISQWKSPSYRNQHILTNQSEMHNMWHPLWSNGWFLTALIFTDDFSFCETGHLRLESKSCAWPEWLYGMSWHLLWP